MKAVVYDAPRSFAINEVPDPQPGPGEVRIRVIQVGVCGTDLHIHNGDFNAAFPLIPGHELVGTVESVGDGVTRVNVGEQVSVNPNVNCGLCDYCLAGNPIRCTALQGLGSNFPGFLRGVRRGSLSAWSSRPKASRSTRPSSPSRQLARCMGWNASGCGQGLQRWCLGRGPQVSCSPS